MPPQESTFATRDACYTPRRQSVSAPTSPVASLYDMERAFYHSPQPAPRRKVYESPLLDACNLLPNEQLQTHEARWKYMSNLAGKHRQDDSTLFINPERVSTPHALQAGMMKQAALRVTTLHLPILDAEQKEDDDSLVKLPAWLDAIVVTFPNVRHLHLLKAEHGADASMDEVTDLTDKYTVMDAGLRSATAVHHGHDRHVKADEINAVRRLYVLYRVTELESLDGLPFSEKEREFSRFKSRQASPAKVQSSDDGRTEQADAKLTANCVETSLMDQDDDENDDPSNAHYSPIRLTRRTTSDLAVEIDVDGKPHCNTFKAKSRSFVSRDDVIRSPPRLSDDDRWEYESVESSAACEWTAACGVLTLPYFKLPRTGSAAATRNRDAKSKFHLKRRTEIQARHVVTVPPPGTALAYRATTAAAAPRFAESMDSKQRSSESQAPFRREAFFEPPLGPSPCAMVHSPRLTLDEKSYQRPPSQCNSPCSTSSQGSAGHAKLRVPASQSLSSPFPLQFRIRANVSLTDDEALQKCDDLLELGKQQLQVLTDIESVHQAVPPPPHPRDAMETIELPIPLVRTQSSPTNLPSSRHRLMPPPIITKNDLPPPCPGRRRPTLLASSVPLCNSSVKASTRKAQRGKWREKLSARSASIMDMDDNGCASSDDE